MTTILSKLLNQAEETINYIMDYGIGTCEGKIRVIEHRASKEIRGYHSLPPYNSQPTDTSKASKELFF